VPRRMVDAFSRDPLPALHLRAATVTGTPGGGVVETDLSGGTVEAPYLATYSPIVGDVVQILQQGSQLLVLGPAAT
jgi:hypothetical protein